MNDEVLLKGMWVTPGYQSSLRYHCDIVCCQAAVIDCLYTTGWTVAAASLPGQGVWGKKNPPQTPQKHKDPAILWAVASI